MLKGYLTRVALVALVTVAAAAGTASAADPAHDKLKADFEKAWAAGDAKAIAALYTEDAVRVTDGGAVVGRAAIEEEFTTTFAGRSKGTQIAIQIGHTVAVGPDVSVGEGTYEVTGVKAPDGTPVPVKGTFLNTLVKKDGVWLIAGNAASSPPPAE